LRLRWLNYGCSSAALTAGVRAARVIRRSAYMDTSTRSAMRGLACADPLVVVARGANVMFTICVALFLAVQHVPPSCSAATSTVRWPELWCGLNE
jgi:hypothetical protein